jgi:VanZ family protein
MSSNANAASGTGFNAWCRSRVSPSSRWNRRSGWAPTTPAARCAGSSSPSSATSADARWEILHHLIRKSGHFLGYGAIGLLWLRAWWMTLPRSRFLHDAFLALLGTALVASADEWHQTFLPNRTGSPWDVLLDCCGAIALELAGLRLHANVLSNPLRRDPAHLSRNAYLPASAISKDTRFSATWP